MLPCLIYEDDHLLVVNKPVGLNTHAPSAYGGEGLYDWLRHREPGWAGLGIMHRLDKETSGLIVFSKTPTASRSLTEQFTHRMVRKQYLLLTDREPPRKEVTVKTSLVRAGERYISRPRHAGADAAETRFKFLGPVDSQRLPSSSHFALRSSHFLVAAFPLTGRTHQIRVHAAEQGFPILGDVLYGGTPAQRVCLHAAELAFRHPVTGEEMQFRAPVDFSLDTRFQLRAALIDPDSTNAYRLIHGASDGWPGSYVERLGEYLLSQSEQMLGAPQREELARLMKVVGARGAYHRPLSRQVRQTNPCESSAQLAIGEPAPERFTVCENGLEFELSFEEGYSVGLFLDQRDNRRRLLTGHIAAGFPTAQSEIGTRKLEILNTFAYTCGFSVCAAKAGAQTTSLDLSRKYLDWGKRNFSLNHLDPAEHDFIYGDVFDWLRRLGKKQRQFDLILLDPPTFSQSRQSGVFRVERDYTKLTAAALPLLRPGGILLASTNSADWPAEQFLEHVEKAIQSAHRKIRSRHYVPQPPDFPISRSEPACLKTVWLRID